MKQRYAVNTLRIVGGRTSLVHQLQNSNLLDLRLYKLIAARKLCGATLAKRNQCRNVPAIHTLDTPIDDLLSRVKRRISAVLEITLPINQRASAANSDHFVDDILGVTEHPSAKHIRIVSEPSQHLCNTQ